MSGAGEEQSLEIERLARAALSLLAEPGDLRVSGLAADLGPVRLRELLGAERDVTGCGTDVAARLGQVEPEAVLEASARAGIRFVIPGDSEWPLPLGDLHDISVVEQRGWSAEIGRAGRCGVGGRCARGHDLRLRDGERDRGYRR